ncbi:MAG: type II toxin-antitoxin system RatA family toxin [Burkholderiales bacterium]|nr:type II toxin-antitoxin system RatA family toxin [Burkholderiales bacterium]
MVTVERSALVGHGAAALFAVVVDVEAYPAFLPWCASATLVQGDAQQAVATLGIGYRGVRQRFTTRNTMRQGERIDMQLVDGPFRRLDGTWRFTTLAPRACRVDLRLAYELASPLVARAIGPAFEHIAGTLVDAFVRRADALYGA